MPRPACPFCTRALACGTYSQAYHCGADQLGAVAATWGREILQDPDPDLYDTDTEGDPDLDAGGSTREQAPAREAKRAAVAGYAKWMARHVALKEAYPRDFRYKPALDWEMREPPPNARARTAAEGEDAREEGAARRRLAGARPVVQGFVDGSAWVAAVLAGNVTQPFEDVAAAGPGGGAAGGGAEVGGAAQLAARVAALHSEMRLPPPFCARHETR
jgi:hypothetical protein